MSLTGSSLCYGVGCLLSPACSSIGRKREWPSSGRCVVHAAALSDNGMRTTRFGWNVIENLDGSEVEEGAIDVRL